MIITPEHFKGSKIGRSIIDPQERIKKALDEKFSKGIIDADLYNKTMAQLNPKDNIEKGEIMDRLSYGYGPNNEPIKFTKTGKELKEMMPGIIAKLTANKAVMLGKMSAYQTLAGIEPMEPYGNTGMMKYPYDYCRPSYDESTKSYPAQTEQNKACEAYNDCCYQVRSIDEDIVACQAIVAGADDKQKYNLTIAQLIALTAK